MRHNERWPFWSETCSRTHNAFRVAMMMMLGGHAKRRNMLPGTTSRTPLYCYHVPHGVRITPCWETPCCEKKKATSKIHNLHLVLCQNLVHGMRWKNFFQCFQRNPKSLLLTCNWSHQNSGKHQRHVTHQWCHLRRHKGIKTLSLPPTYYLRVFAQLPCQPQNFGTLPFPVQELRLHSVGFVANYK